MDSVENIIFKLILTTSLISLIASWGISLQRKKLLFFFSFIITAVNCSLQFFYLLFFLFGESLGRSSQVLFCCAFLLNLVFLLLIRKKNNFYWVMVIPWFAFFLLLLATLLSDYNSVLLNEKAIITQELLILGHIISFVIFYLILAVILLSSIFVVVVHFSLRRKKILWNFPSLGNLYKVNSFLTNIGFLFISISLFLTLWLQFVLAENNIGFLNNLSLRIIIPIFLFFIYSCFMLAKKNFSITKITEVFMTLCICLLALVSFILEIQFLF